MGEGDRVRSFFKSKHRAGVVDAVGTHQDLFYLMLWFLLATGLSLSPVLRIALAGKCLGAQPVLLYYRVAGSP